MLNGKQYQLDSLPPLRVDVKENHLDLGGIFNSPVCRNNVREILGNDAELFASVNPRNKTDLQNPAPGIAKITKHGRVQCIAGHEMVFPSKDYKPGG
ncbi:MAG: hypothetical protein QGI86_00775 [Candidatus Poribacteria bacterium]|nr:hypothetical protein [Candidatus Poribacteria bacterium]MDP6747414.1 hypothetical protein [Candidatus Poribacteria bacterium]